MQRVDALHQQLDGIAAAFEGALALTDGDQQGEEADALRECSSLLKQALSLVRDGKARAPKRGGSSSGQRSTVAEMVSTMEEDALMPTSAPSVTMLSLASLGQQQVLDTQDTVLDVLDPEEREERELAALRAQFVAGAAEDDEQLDWSAVDGGSDDEGEAATSDPSDGAALELLDSLPLPSAPSSESQVVSWAALENFVPQGAPGFNDFAREQMRLAGVPANPCVRPPEELEAPQWVAAEQRPKLQPYQETVSYLCRPQSLPNPRMLVVHRTGCGKTATMIQIADNYFKDRRPKVLIFPTNAVCNSFYRELRNPNFPNRYDAYLERGNFPDARKALELTGILRNGTVAREFLDHPELPSAPLRAFSYTMAGGASSCGARPNAVFKCPDGYAGSYPECLPRLGGYDDFACKGNPFSNKIVLMDEVGGMPCSPRSPRSPHSPRQAASQYPSRRVLPHPVASSPIPPPSRQAFLPSSAPTPLSPLLPLSQALQNRGPIVGHGHPLAARARRFLPLRSACRD